MRINSDQAACFLYAANGSTAVPGGLMLPAPPVVLACNRSGAPARLKADDEAAPRRTPQQPGCFLDKGAIGSGQKGRQMVHQVCEQTGMCSALTRERLGC